MGSQKKRLYNQLESKLQKGHVSPLKNVTVLYIIKIVANEMEILYEKIQNTQDYSQKQLQKIQIFIQVPDCNRLQVSCWACFFIHGNTLLKMSCVPDSNFAVLKNGICERVYLYGLEKIATIARYFAPLFTLLGLCNEHP